MGEKISLFAGPSLTIDVAYFRDIAVSAGVLYYFKDKTGLVLSLFTFTLYDYNIDYLYVPASLSYIIFF